MMLTEAHFKILQPVIFICRIFGLCPVTFKKVGNYYQIRYNSIMVLYSYAVLIVFGTATILGVRRDIDAGANAVRMKNSRTRYITISDMAMVFIIAFCGVVTIPYRMKRFVRMVDIWSIVDKMLPVTEYRKYQKVSIILIIGGVAATTALFLFDMFIYCMQWRISNNPTFYVQNYIGYYMLYFMMIFQEIFFWHLVFFIHLRIRSLNEQLFIERNKMKNNPKKVFCIPYSLTNNGKKQEMLVENVQIFEKVSTGPTSDEKPKKNTEERIQELMNIYGKIRESVEILNDSASYGVVLIILSCLLHLIVTPYFLLAEIFKKSPSPVFMTLQAVWFAGHIGRLLIMVEPCETCLREYKVTNTLVSELSLLDFDTTTKKNLKAFASQFSYATINFNACGFFNINRSLLTSGIYFRLLVQLQLISLYCFK
ncbi:gustatory receptor for sugar taste 43a-like isoform X2 [Anthonomus grandis grandis]|uniref:gustatory receptor for sugar taste 43a-like isoform X2 n=1 Tax=Anthonomus grandis grandis TaxID=2921223 RepID=UPI0021660BDB|nr:gustatory receptor for sugar taste 43a-like isoform X2 [Anthonomus grandis grandis]